MGGALFSIKIKMAITKYVIFILALFVALGDITVNQPALAQSSDTSDSALSAPLPGLVDTSPIVAAPEPCVDLTHKGPDKKADNLPSYRPIILHKVIPIILENSISSTSVRVGEPVKAKLKEDLYYGSLLVAPANSILNGRVTSCRNGRTLAASLLQTEDRSKANAALEISFDNLFTDKSLVLPLIGRPVHQESIKQGSDGFFYGITVNHQGKIVRGGRTLSQNQRTTYKTLRIVTACPLPAGILLNLSAAPLIMGVVGAASPNVAFNRPLDPSVSHKRVKGMTYGFATNLPGAFLVQAVVEKGNEIVLNKGDELMIDIIVNDQFHCPSVLSAQPDTLSVKAELLNSPLDGSIVENRALSLPLKPFMNFSNAPKSFSNGAALSTTLRVTSN